MDSTSGDESQKDFRRKRHRKQTTEDSYVCSICGDLAASYNFGAICCESCKAFYRRSLTSQVSFFDIVSWLTAKFQHLCFLHSAPTLVRAAIDVSLISKRASCVLVAECENVAKLEWVAIHWLWPTSKRCVLGYVLAVSLPERSWHRATRKNRSLLPARLLIRTRSVN